MNLLAPISTIMTGNPITVSPSDQIKKVEEIFEEHNFKHLPVVDKGELVGLVSKTDYLLFKRGFNLDSSENRIDEFRLKSRNVTDIMTKKLGKVEATDRINVALEVFKLNQIHALPVVENDRLVGIVTTMDIIDALAADGEATQEY